MKKIAAIEAAGSEEEIQKILSEDAMLVVSGLDAMGTPLKVYIYADDTGFVVNYTGDVALVLPITEVAFETHYDTETIFEN